MELKCTGLEANKHSGTACGAVAGSLAALILLLAASNAGATLLGVEISACLAADNGANCITTDVPNLWTDPTAIVGGGREYSRVTNLPSTGESTLFSANIQEDISGSLTLAIGANVNAGQCREIPFFGGVIFDCPTHGFNLAWAFEDLLWAGVQGGGTITNVSLMYR